MHFTPLPLKGLIRITLEPFRDNRGSLAEVFRKDLFSEYGLPTEFVHQYQSTSDKDVLRGLHFQHTPPIGKLLRVTRGRGYIVTADIRHESSTRGTWFAEELSADVKSLLYVPAGFATGICALENFTQLECACTGPYNGPGEGSIVWNDPTLAIKWPLQNPTLSERDKNAPTYQDWLFSPEAHTL